jgi:hypothetical protein
LCEFPLQIFGSLPSLGCKLFCTFHLFREGPGGSKLFAESSIFSFYLHELHGEVRHHAGRSEDRLTGKEHRSN